jgi:hypothetical protein
MTYLPNCPDCGDAMLVAPAETVNTQLEVDVYECDWCHIVYFSEAMPITGGPRSSQPYDLTEP